MQSEIQSVNGGLALAIPPSLACAAHLQSGTLVDVTLAEGRLVISPQAGSTLSLDELLAGITADNLHNEIDLGTPVGGEAW